MNLSSNEETKVVEKVDRLLELVDPTPFSEPAFLVLKGKIAQYISDLVNESSVASKRDNADSISAKHVEIASQRLILYNQKKMYKHLGNFGGLLIGVFISTLISIMTTKQENPLILFGICAISGAIGAFLLAISIAKE